MPPLSLSPLSQLPSPLLPISQVRLRRQTGLLVCTSQCAGDGGRGTVKRSSDIHDGTDDVCVGREWGYAYLC